ncbi:MAG: hypothetical protein HYY35_08120 [Deltaproteobacteria bacterium]|nr:hypothetical protein [Deltaproteobacteria bacterium]
MDARRAARIAGVFLAAWLVLYVRFSAGVFTPTEVDPFVHWALLPIALLIGAANAAMEVNRSASVPRRDSLWGLSSGLASFAILHWAKVV